MKLRPREFMRTSLPARSFRLCLTGVLEISQKNSRRLELSISKNTPHGRLEQGPGSVGPRFLAGLPFPVPEIPEYVAFGNSGRIFQQFSRDFPAIFLQNSRTDPGNSHSLLEFSDNRRFSQLSDYVFFLPPLFCQRHSAFWT